MNHGPHADAHQADAVPSRRRGVGSYVVAVIVLLSLLLYVGSYIHLSRRGMREAQQYGMKGFLYLPLEEVCRKQDLSEHHTRARFFSPLNWLDRKFFKGEGPSCCLLWGLSK